MSISRNFLLSAAIILVPTLTSAGGHSAFGGHGTSVITGSSTMEGKTGDLGNPESWCVAGEIRISNFKTICENDNYIVATHDVGQDGKPHSNVMVYAEQRNGKFTYWKIQRAFEV